MGDDNSAIPLSELCTRDGCGCEFGAGEAVIREGESGDTMYLVERGSAEVQIAGVGRVVEPETLEKWIKVSNEV